MMQQLSLIRVDFRIVTNAHSIVNKKDHDKSLDSHDSMVKTDYNNPESVLEAIRE